MILQQASEYLLMRICQEMAECNHLNFLFDSENNTPVLTKNIDLDKLPSVFSVLESSHHQPMNHGCNSLDFRA